MLQHSYSKVGLFSSRHQFAGGGSWSVCKRQDAEIAIAGLEGQQRPR